MHESVKCTKSTEGHNKFHLKSYVCISCMLQQVLLFRRCFFLLFTFCYSAFRFRRTNGQVWFGECFRVERGNCVCDVIWMTICRRRTVNVRRCVLDSQFDICRNLLFMFSFKFKKAKSLLWSGEVIQNRAVRTLQTLCWVDKCAFEILWIYLVMIKTLCVFLFIFCCLFRSLQRDKSIWAHQVPYYYVI